MINHRKVVFICNILRLDTCRIPGLLRFHKFTCCLLADIPYSRYEQNEFERSNWVHFSVWKAFALAFHNNLILSDCFTVTGKKVVFIFQKI